MIEQLKKQAEADLIAQKKKTEEVMGENAALKKLLEAQTSETATAQKSIDKMHEGNIFDLI